MNIFAYCDNPWQSALWLDDVRKRKMILESAQMLSTAIRTNDPLTTLPVYKSHQPQHPCNIWARRSRSNFNWLCFWMHNLLFLQGGNHASGLLLPHFYEYSLNGWFPREDRTPFANAAASKRHNLDFKHIPDVHEAYKQYHIARWKLDNPKPTWILGEEPSWRT